jgi:glycosyltransferase involved in cell wall biosynthesis
MLPISVVVPVRNAEFFINECLTSIVQAEPAEIILVDGLSTDRTLECAKNFPVKVISDEGKGVPAARMMGIRAASYPNVALIDVDIVLPDGALSSLYEEYVEGDYHALQAGLVSISGAGYWGKALVHHHNNGRSKNWPGLMSTIFKKKVLLKFPLDERFRSGEDIEIRWRLRQENYKMGVSRTTQVFHRFEDTYDHAKGQWVADGKGLGRMFAKYGWKAGLMLAIPAAGSARGILRSLLQLQPQWIPYFLGYLLYNYAAMPEGIRENLADRPVLSEQQMAEG